MVIYFNKSAGRSTHIGVFPDVHSVTGTTRCWTIPVIRGLRLSHERDVTVISGHMNDVPLTIKRVPDEEALEIRALDKVSIVRSNRQFTSWLHSLDWTINKQQTQTLNCVSEKQQTSSARAEELIKQRQQKKSVSELSVDYKSFKETEMSKVNTSITVEQITVVDGRPAKDMSVADLINIIESEKKIIERLRGLPGSLNADRPAYKMIEKHTANIAALEGVLADKVE